MIMFTLEGVYVDRTVGRHRDHRGESPSFRNEKVMRSQHHHRRSPRSLRLEVLEDRCLLSYTLTDLGNLGGTFTSPAGLNDAGQVVGTSRTANPHNYGDPFLWDSSNGMQDLGTLGGPPNSLVTSVAYAINSQGMVAGEAAATDFVDVYHAFFYSDGTMTDLGKLPGVDYTADSTAYGINDAGQVVGYAVFVPVFYDERAFLWDSQNGIQNLGTLGGEFSFAYGISTSGQVVGDADVRDGVRHAFVWDRQNGMQDLNSLIPPSGLELNQARAINDAGQIVGNAGNYPQIQAYLYSAGTVTGLGFLPGFVNSYATALNNAGQVVGYATNASFSGARAFVYADGTMADLNDLVPPGSGLTLTVAAGINNAGQIACSAQDAMGHYHAVLLTPDDGPSPRSAVPGVFQVLATMPEAARRITDTAAVPQAGAAPAWPAQIAISPPVGSTEHRATDAVFAAFHRAHPSHSERGWEVDAWSSASIVDEVT
jgi:probable HAF family extracellular repeat protein